MRALNVNTRNVAGDFIMRRRVVITGMGAVTPLGHSVKELYEQQLEGKSGVDYIKNFDASTFPTKFAAELKGFDLANFVKARSRWKHAGANARFAAAAAQQALDHAGVADPGKTDRGRFGIYLGSGEGVQDFNTMTRLISAGFKKDNYSVDFPTFIKMGISGFDPAGEYEQEMHTTPGHLANQIGRA